MKKLMKWMVIGAGVTGACVLLGLLLLVVGASAIKTVFLDESPEAKKILYTLAAPKDAWKISFNLHMQEAVTADRQNFLTEDYVRRLKEHLLADHPQAFQDQQALKVLDDLSFNAAMRAHVEEAALAQRQGNWTEEYATEWKKHIKKEHGYDVDEEVRKDKEREKQAAEAAAPAPPSSSREPSVSVNPASPLPPWQRFGPKAAQ